jgi:general secretion pathway protein J
MARQRNAGFTLVELLVGLFAMALLAVLSWQGLDGMSRAQAHTQERADRVLSLQVGLAQWSADLDAITQLPQLTAIEWNGRVLRLTRRGSGPASEGVLVVGWTRRSVNGVGSWLRWQSPPLTTRGAVEQAWLRADVWSQTPSEDDRSREVAVVPLEGWQIYFFRENAWTNPLSSDVRTGSAAAPAATTGASGGRIATAVIPDGVRLELDLPTGQAIGGRLTRDWASPTVSGGRS